jgi:DnaK suppressor protein
MTEAEKLRLRSALTKKRDELVHDIHTHAVRLTISEGEHDAIDQVQSMTQRDEAVAILNSMWTNLSNIDAALLALDEDTYGACVECGEAIALRRLQTIPWASHCIHCQEELERRASEHAGRPLPRFDQRDQAA